ncbi:hypothetical protein HZA39_00270 [Candidatus Peregrinibacteria bacterium]|nr:hypothetical protein [Candidatus Peregrinibacteria bacterium]
MKIHVIPICEITAEQKARLKKLGSVRFFKKAPINDKSFLKKCAGAEVLLTTPRPPIDIVPHLKKCKFISIIATGFDGINVKLSREKGILVSNVPAYATQSVVEHIFAMILNLCRKIKEAEKIVRSGKWDMELMVSATELYGKTLGIFGFGKIGKRLSEIAKVFGMRVIVHTRSRDAGTPDIDFVDFKKLLNDSDVIVLCAPLTSETFHKFGEKEFRMMKRKPIFINTSRGAVVDEKALIKALKNKWISGAGIDVFEKEPISARHPLCKFSNNAVRLGGTQAKEISPPQAETNVILTPHAAWGSAEATKRLMDIAIQNVEDFLKGSPKNVVNN